MVELQEKNKTINFLLTQVDNLKRQITSDAKQYENQIVEVKENSNKIQEQLENAQPSIFVRLCGSDSSFNALQPSNAFAPISVTPFSMTTRSSAVHSLKLLHPNLFTDPGMVISVSEVQ